MRHLTQFLLFSFIIFLLPGSLHANVNGIPLKLYPQQSLLMDSLNVEHNDYLGEIFLVPEGNFNHRETAEIIVRIDRLPTEMLRKIVEQDIQIALFEGKLTDNPSARGLKGITPRGYASGKTWDEVPGVGGSRLVLVKIGSSDKGQGHGSVNLELHELAHSVDRHVYGLIREDPRFLEIWKQESKFLFPGKAYFLDYPEEYFAETFAMFYLDGQHKKLLKDVAPQTFRYIEALD
ncbi:toxin [Mesobacillus campisalis]|uniref:Toxin n=1 Tax=Mesobacillus campisalis TaxID=1408103 RepID=A0A0M2SVE4_9BACI|nr:toxin [Mesobacillus campisalis]KKK37676.1 toxin [Mesobacillus campisalis]